MNKKQIHRSAIIIFTFFIAFYGRRFLAPYFSLDIHSDYLRTIYSYSWWVIPTLFVTGLLFGFNQLFKNLGLDQGIQTGIAFSILAVAPMFIGFAIIGEMNEDIKMWTLLRGTLFAGFFEEYLFRGFLFGLLFRKLGWGFIPAAVSGALIFGLGHISQGNTIMETTGVFFVTAIGAVWFAWLYTEWNENLWIPIFLHFLMNLSWTIFEVSPNALGGVNENVFRILTIIITIILTINKGRRAGHKIHKGNLWIQAST